MNTLINNCFSKNEGNENINKKIKTLEKGTVLTANPISTKEHMASFDCVYKLEGVRDWLFEQSK